MTTAGGVGSPSLLCWTSAVDADAADPLAAGSLALAGLASAAVQGRLALGPRAGTRVKRLGHDPDAPWVESSRPLQARCDGCDLHAGVTVAGARVGTGRQPGGGGGRHGHGVRDGAGGVQCAGCSGVRTDSGHRFGVAPAAASFDATVALAVGRSAPARLWGCF